ncbi:hypothetical protein CGCF413_v013290 [Colletotrichum fructicola]|nr:hypothetical protein CGCF245_v009490 [Colletotrichum fructicola]KAF5486125.1 hypothetical protein CGCF413_v013290 [Colletotrichum fructicola]
MRISLGKPDTWNLDLPDPNKIIGDSDYTLDVDPSQASQQVLTFRRAFPDYVLGTENDCRKDEWTAEDEVIPVVWARSAQSKIQRSIGDMEDQFGHLPVAQTPLNKKLLRIYFDVLSRFKASLTGDPDPSNPFIKHYAPFCIQEPLVVQTIMYASACYIHETGHLPRTALMASKGRAIHMLNQRISSGRNSAAASNTGHVGETSGTNDAAIASVIQLAAAEWYWGDNNEDVQHHFKGLRDMIRLRGGFDRLGMNGILAKNAICHDVSIALAHENSPLLLLHPQEDCSNGSGGGDPRTPWTADYTFADPIKDVPLRMTHSAPFVCSLSSVGTLPSYAECSQSLGIHRATASILDNVRFLFKAVEAAYVATNETTDPSTETATTTSTTTTGAPTKAASRKVQLMGRYIHEHIQSLHPTIPGHRQSSPGVSTRGNSPGLNYYAGADGGSTRSGSISSIGTAAGPSSGGPGRSPPEPGYDPASTPEWASAPDASDSPTSPKSTATAPHHHHHHRQQQQQHNSDYMYQAIRATAIVYSRAIMNRTPLSVACTQPEFLQIWATVWRVPLSAWNSSVGTFHWIMLAIAPACHTTPHGRFVKNMLMVSTLALGVDNWAVAIGAAKAGLKLQHWLKGQDAETESEEGAEEDDGEGQGDGGGRGGGRWRSGREER